MKHWATDYIGLPWIKGGRGPDSYDCLGFFAHVQRTQYDVQISVDDSLDNLASTLKLINDSDERKRWYQVERPKEGDAVLMARNRVPVHIGTWISANNTNGVLHCAQPVGVVFQTLSGLRTGGWGGITYYRRKREN